MAHIPTADCRAFHVERHLAASGYNAFRALLTVGLRFSADGAEIAEL